MFKKAVGLFVFTVIGTDVVAVCQRRGSFNFKDMKQESWAGLLQPTCHGKLEEGEEYLDALWREVEEELGDSGFLPDENGRGLVVLVDGVVKTYAAMVDPSLIATMQLHSSTGGFRLVSYGDISIIRSALPEYRLNGVPPLIDAMFDDDYEALKEGFRHFVQ